jgi:hypothetical protein
MKKILLAILCILMVALGIIVGDGKAQTHTILGRVIDSRAGIGGIAGVTMTGLPDNPTTDSNGNYSGTVPLNWSGTIKPQKIGYAIFPFFTEYTNVATNQTQDYTAMLLPKVALFMEPTTYNLGNPINIVMTLENQGNNFFTSQGFMASNFALFLQFYDPDGKLITSNFGIGRTPFPPPVVPITTAEDKVELLPVEYVESVPANWVVSMPFNVLDYYTLTKGGNYSVKAKISVRAYLSGSVSETDPKYGQLDSGSSGDIESNTINFALTGITVTSPNGGETWPIGSTQTIHWTSSGITGNVKIEVSRNGGESTSWATITNSTANDGAYKWKVTGPATEQARIRVSSVKAPTVSDISDANFTIGGGSITVTSPNGGETWPIGSTQTIHWTSRGLTGNVKIEVSRVLRDESTSWAVIVSSTPNDGTYNWKVTGPATTQAQIRITSVTDPTVTDVSNANFTITPSITVTSPNGGETWAIGSTHTIHWTSKEITGNVKIEVSRNGGTSWATIIGSTPNSGTYSWKVTGPATPQAQIRITSVTDPTVWDTSGANFKIK